jgi:hypothetical protein
MQALHKKNMSIQEFYSIMTNLQDQLTLTKSVELKACDAYIARHRLIQFLMALHNEFKRLKGLILHHSPFLSIDSVVSELLAEEIRLQSYSEKGIISTSNPYVLAVSFKPLFNNQNKLYISDAFDECSFYK